MHSKNDGNIGRRTSFAQRSSSCSPHMPMLPSTPPRTLSESASASSMPLIRKKSGEILKSSLKCRSASASRHRPTLSLSDLASIPLLSPSVSAPATPQAAGVKMVHFDAQLEHVRLFVAEQKPAAVSRDGSPIFDDTMSSGEGDSGTEWSGAAWPARPKQRRLVPGGATSDEEAAVRRVLMMRVLNMPARLGGSEVCDKDVLLEGLHLADDASSVQGTVRVRNIAFEKNVAVRFTFDGWQTTSEVLARWAESCAPPSPSAGFFPAAPSASICSDSSTRIIELKDQGPAYDRFAFSIRLADMLLRIDEKTLVLAVRYRAAGSEMWDNNGGQNYRTVFERRTPTGLTLTGSAVVAARLDTSKAGVSEKKDSFGSTSVGDGKSSALGVSLYGTLDKVNVKDSEDTASPAKKAADPLASRYDLGASLKNRTAWKPSFEHALTWAGHSQARSGVYPRRSALPWPTDKNAVPLNKPSMASTGVYSKARSFESHNLDFTNARGRGRGSPRDLGSLDDMDSAKFCGSRTGFSAELDARASEDRPFPHCGPNDVSSSVAHGNARKHYRSSYFDTWSSGYADRPSSIGFGKVRLTPPGTPGSHTSHRSLSDADVFFQPSQGSSFTETPRSEHPPPTSPGRCHSFPPLSGPTDAGLGIVAPHPWGQVPHGLMHDTGDSDASTPSVTSMSESSPTMTPSPSSPPDFSMLSPMVQTGSAFPDSASMDSSSYSVFLDKFCFYTGHEGLLDISTDIRRSHSASSVEGLLSSPSSSSIDAFSFFKGSFHASMGHRATTPTMPSSPCELSPDAETPTSATLLKCGYQFPTRVHV
ncbi:putative phosphatase regulatory subunit-domain-containing protein [Phellopilus nigrolimitatus]|nr:putative phosphatase regulatory subunit-domain-containing protein [Phellopilus nigrolimitatus]